MRKAPERRSLVKNSAPLLSHSTTNTKLSGRMGEYDQKEPIRMAFFTVKEVVDGDTFNVVNGWKLDGKTVDFVRPLGYNTPEKGEPGYQVAKDKLRNLIQGKQVDIRKAVSVDSYGRLLAEVYYNGKNLADYFPEYK